MASNPSYQFKIRGFLLYMEYDKPFKTYDELIELMVSRNILVSDRSFAKRALSNMSYYTLVNGYKNTFLSVDGSDVFVPGTKFEELYTIHIIDTSFSSIILKFILHIEHSLKSKISYIVAKNYGVYTDFSNPVATDKSDYLCLYNYGSSTGQRRNILERINACGIETRNNLSLLHYKNNKNHVPPWILIENVPFGLAVKWYNILKGTDKGYVCESLIQGSSLPIEAKKELLLKALYILKDYRNSIAHGHRTFENITSYELPKIPLLSIAPDLLSEHEYLSGIGKNDLYSVVIIISILLNDPHLMENFIRDILFTFQPYLESKVQFCNKSILDVFSLPEDMFERLEAFTHNKYISSTR